MMDHLAKTEFNARLPEALEIIQDYEAICKGQERQAWANMDTRLKMTIGVVAAFLRHRSSGAKQMDIRHLICTAAGIVKTAAQSRY
jgi:hypothetical protein